MFNIQHLNLFISNMLVIEITDLLCFLTIKDIYNLIQTSQYFSNTIEVIYTHSRVFQRVACLIGLKTT